jgi:hypothetical protein
VIQFGIGMLFVVVAIVGMAGGARGQDVSGAAGELADSTAPRVAGTVSEFVLALHGLALNPLTAGDAATLGSFVNSRTCSVTCNVVGSVVLPSGVRVVGLGLDAFDSDSNGLVAVTLSRCPVGGGLCPTLAGLSTGLAATPGQTQLRLDPATPPTIDNDLNTYLVFVQIAGGTTASRLTGIRIFYQLQVTPAPAVATFSDVPIGHPFFRFVQALVAAGITAGCGGGRFCVDDPITRGQMAVFLSLALGLHFAP